MQGGKEWQAELETPAHGARGVLDYPASSRRAKQGGLGRRFCLKSFGKIIMSSTCQRAIVHLVQVGRLRTRRRVQRAVRGGAPPYHKHVPGATKPAYPGRFWVRLARGAKTMHAGVPAGSRALTCRPHPSHNTHTPPQGNWKHHSTQQSVAGTSNKKGRRSCVSLLLLGQAHAC